MPPWHLRGKKTCEGIIFEKNKSEKHQQKNTVRKMSKSENGTSNFSKISIKQLENWKFRRLGSSNLRRFQLFFHTRPLPLVASANGVGVRFTVIEI